MCMHTLERNTWILSLKYGAQTIKQRASYVLFIIYHCLKKVYFFKCEQFIKQKHEQIQTSIAYIRFTTVLCQPCL